MTATEKELKELGVHLRKEMSLSAPEKAEMRGHLSAFMLENPLPAASERSSGMKRLHNSRARISGPVNTKTTMGISILIALLLGGSVSFASESAIPGDMLYPIKVHMNENIRDAFAVSDEAQAKLDADLAAERLLEAEKLAADGRLNASVQAQLGAEFTARAKGAEEGALKLSHEGKGEAAAEVVSAIELSTKTHTGILSALVVTKPALEVEVGALLQTVRSSREDATEIRHNVEAQARVKAESVGIEASSSEENKVESVTTVDGKEEGIGDRKDNGAGIDTKVDTNINVESPLHIKTETSGSGSLKVGL